MVYGGQTWIWAVVIAACLLAIHLNNFNLTAGICLRCGGRGAHRDGCPDKED